MQNLVSDKVPITELCCLEIEGPVAIITISRSEVFNALNVQLISELIDLITWTSSRSVMINETLNDPNDMPYFRALVLKSEGKHFCAGADVNMMRDAGAASPEENRADSKRLDTLFNSLWSHPCFTICCVQGVALGGGAGLVSCVDHVIAEPGTRIALSEGKLGILPAVIGPYVYRKTGSSEFRRLSMIASRISSEEALRIGLVNEIVEDKNNFEQSCREVIENLLTSGPMAVHEAKKLTLVFDRWTGSDEELREWTLEKTSEMRESIEGQEGLSAFLERRPLIGLRSSLRVVVMFPEWMEGAPTPFSSVLVANRGEIAVRVIMAVKEAGLRAIAVYSDSDSNALHVEMADDAVHLTGNSLTENYLNSEAIILARKSSGAQAIHPGYGFLSERADFARDVANAGIIWIGPSPEAIETMGDKISARSRMIESGVPVIPGDEIAIPEGSDHMGALASVVARVGYPLLLKASAGGGGKGMRVVHEPKMLRTEYEAAAREASAAFGDGTVYVERLLTGARHIEIQVLADKHGNCIHLNERDCSLQRRHQKVIEEAPSTAVSNDLRKSMGESAVLAAMAVDYVGAGTVELLLSPNGQYYFLEMNTRYASRTSSNRDDYRC